jgi:hypothetical protein
MSRAKKLIVCVLLTQFATSCGASLPDQCKQLKAVHEAYTEKKSPIPSRQFEILSEQFSQKSKDLEKLSISDKNLKEIQQRFIKYYDSHAKNLIAQSATEKQIEMLKREPASKDKNNRLLAIIKEGREPRDQGISLSQEYFTIVADMQKICSTK